MNNKEALLSVLQSANEAAQGAYSGSSEAFKAEPLYMVVQHENMMDDSSPVVSRSVLPELCGFASLRCGGRDLIIRLIKKYGKATYRQQAFYEVGNVKPEKTGYEFNGWHISKAYGGGYHVSLPAEKKWGQGMVSKERGLHAAIPLLKEIGSFWVWTHID